MEHFQMSSYLKHVGAPFKIKKKKKERKENPELSAFCWDRITLFHSTELSLKYLIMKSRRYRKKNWRYMCSFWIRVTSFLLAISSCFPPHNVPPPRLPFSPSSPLPSSSNSIALFSLPSSRIESAWWKQISLQHHNRMADAGKMNPNGFFFFFLNVLKIEYKAWPPDVVDPFQQPRYCL